MSSDQPSKPPALQHIFSSADHAWTDLLNDVLRAGAPVAPRGMKTLELLAYRKIFDMRFPVITNDKRKLGYRFLPAEAAWILSGDNRLETISPYSKLIGQFSDDGKTFSGAYGTRIKRQLPAVVAVLARDPMTRQAVIDIWQDVVRDTKDVSCTLSVQFLLRGGWLHTIVTMRSSDAWLGWVYDVFNFTMLTGLVALHLRAASGRAPKLGTLTMNCGSQHLYEPQWQDAMSACGLGAASLFDYDEFNPLEFGDPDNLIEHLWALANRNEAGLRGRWLRELVPGWAAPEPPRAA